MNEAPSRDYVTKRGCRRGEGRGFLRRRYEDEGVEKGRKILKREEKSKGRQRVLDFKDARPFLYLIAREIARTSCEIVRPMCERDDSEK